MLKGAKGSWIDDLSGIMWSTRTTVLEATWQTPFNLVYGSEVVLPIEVGIPSPRITFYDNNNNEEEKKVNLDLRLETIGSALSKVISYKLKLTQLFNRLVKH